MEDFKKQLAPGWSSVNIGITVVLFLIAWPFALAMIAYIVWGNKLGLDLSQPATLGIFAQRIAGAWRAAVKAFKNPSPKP
ncbi:MAG: DUF2852 domain-containing protein [Granulosicoccus sp.]